MDQPVYLSHSTNLSAEVEPFIPRSDIGTMMAEHMISHESQQGQLPHFMTSCYPFVQDQAADSSKAGSQYDYQNYYARDMRDWPSPGAGAPYQPHPIAPPSRYSVPPNQGPAPSMPLPSAHSASIYTYHPGSMQFQYPDFSQSPYLSQMGNGQQLHYQGARSTHGRRDPSRKLNERKLSANKKGQRSVGVQMEVQKTESNSEETSCETTDYAQQTDFPSEIASKTLAEKPSPLKRMTRSSRKWRRSSAAADQSASCNSSDNNGDEADVDSDSGYYSPKHRISRRNHALLSSSGASAGNDRHEIGTTIHPNYPAAELSPQRLVYLSGPPPPPSAYYPAHPSTYLGAPQAPGQIIRLPTPATPPMIMTPPPVMNLTAPGTVGHHQMAALTNFKSRSSWEQEILKAHNVAPICPPAFVPRRRMPHGRGTGQHNWQYPRFQGPRHKSRNPSHQAMYNQGTPAVGVSSSSSASDVLHPGMLRVNPNSAPQCLVQQNPPQLTEEDFPGLQASLGASGSGGGHPLATFSYSAALQNMPKPGDISKDSPIKSLIEPDDSGSGKGQRRRRKKTERAAKAAAEEYAEISKEQENIKKQLKKKTANRSKTPQLDLAEMLSKLEKTQAADSEPDSQTKQPDQHLPGSQYRQQQRFVQASGSQYVIPHNPLDSSAPLKKRGKEREVPKTKKPSALKKVILKEREEKKNSRFSSLTTEENPEYDIPHVPADYFKNEYMQKDGSADNNLSDGVSTSEVNSSKGPSPLTVPVSGNSSPVVPANLPKIHSRRYREYCSGQVLDKQIDEECILILQKLVQFQERMYQRDPIKAKTKRRFVLGIREVTKHLKLKKLCCVLISPNLEKIQSKGGLDDALQQIIQLCKAQSVPHVFALGRCAMGRAVSKVVPVSIIGVFDYSGVEESFKKMLALVKDAQEKYHEMMVVYQQEIVEATATPPTAPTVQTKRFAHMGHSRNASAASCVSFCSMISEPISEMNPSEGMSWRNVMDVTDEQNPTPALSPPPETAQEDEQDDENAADSSCKDKENEIEANQDYEEPPSDEIEESFLSKIDNSGSLTSNDQQSAIDSSYLDKSFSAASTIVAPTQSTMETLESDKGKAKLSTSVEIPIIIEESSPDTEARINSWLASSVQNLVIEDSSAVQERKLQKMEQDRPSQEEDEEDFLSAREDEIEESTK